MYHPQVEVVHYTRHRTATRSCTHQYSLQGWAARTRQRNLFVSLYCTTDHYIQCIVRYAHTVTAVHVLVTQLSLD